MAAKSHDEPIHAHYRVPPKTKVRLGNLDPDESRGVKDKDSGKKLLEAEHKRLRALQERLYAEGKQSLLVVLQALSLIHI